jgi:hypothetical protein
VSRRSVKNVEDRLAIEHGVNPVAHRFLSSPLRVDLKRATDIPSGSELPGL